MAAPPAGAEGLVRPMQPRATVASRERPCRSMDAAPRRLVVAFLLGAACGGEGSVTDATPPPAPGPAPAHGPPPEAAEPERPDEVACTEVVDHMEVVVAQSLGVTAKNLFTDVERRDAIEHCKRYAHPNLVECARSTQALSFLDTCLYFTAVPRPEVEHPTRAACEAYAKRVDEITSVLQTRTLGQAPPPPSPRSRAQYLDACMQDLTPELVECGTKAGSQLGLVSCFSPYAAAKPRWVTAEECEAYADHMTSVIGGYLLAPFPKPEVATQALQQSGLAMYAVPQVQRFQLVTLCHSLDRDLMQCHMKAATAADLGQCVP